MSMVDEWIVFDTNIWIFGLRNQADQAACYQLLQSLSMLKVKIPYQVFLELRANLTPDEVNHFFRLIHIHPDKIELSWEKAPNNSITHFQK